MYQRFGPLRLVQRHCGLRSEHAKHVAVDTFEAAMAAFHIGIQVTQHALLHHQRCHQARPLPSWRYALGPVAQAHSTGGAGLVEPGPDRREQGGRFFTVRQGRAGAHRPIRRIERQQHALRLEQAFGRANQESRPLRDIAHLAQS